MNENRILNFIDGAYTEGSSGRTFEDRNPASNRLVARVHEAGEADVDRAVTAARAALDGEWGTFDAARRAALLHKVADGIMARKDEFAAAERADTGKLKGPTAMIEIPRGAEQFRVFADIVKHCHAETIETTMPDGGMAINYAQRVPKGVIAAICPWNVPFVLMTWKVAPALACGNAIVVKPSEETPATAALLGEIMNEAGVPAGVYNVVQGFGPDSAGAFLTSHPGVDAITFTGETRTGEAIMRSAATGARAVSLELGGKNAAIVFADCDFEKAIMGTMTSVFFNCGQICFGTERVYVERPIYERFVAALKDKVKGLRHGDPADPNTTMAPLISLGHREKVLSYYHQAMADGATVVTGGGIPDMAADWADGAWIEPTIWTDLPEDAAVVREEIFGPCCRIAPFDDEGEIVALANNNDYGLAASVWSQDVSRANRVASKLEVGVVWINSWMIRDLRTPFGGFKKSGLGREGGVHSLEFYTETRNVCVKL
ncbi:MAG: 2-hydroxymuconic semialdehyde dehydrogenase [Sphingomonadales bacterium]